MAQNPPNGGAGGAGMDDDAPGGGNFFGTTKKGEIHELATDLNSFDKIKVKNAVKKVIASMTLGKEMSALFADVVKSMQTDNLELKKLVYLYIINYARQNPEKAILIVNTFQKDASDPNPLIRALAIRTMGCIRVDKITEYLCEPLASALKDKDAYVRKTAALCVAKLYDINRELVEEQGFMDSLRNLIADPNPMVVANAVAAMAEISESSQVDMFKMNQNMLSKLMAALNLCTEWGQVFILDCLAKYEASAKDAEDIIERVSPHLKHSNAAVAMAAIRIIMKYMTYINNPEMESKLLNEKLPPPLITMLSEHKPELQYVALRNINLIVQSKPSILDTGVKHFFCKYNDPVYVKMEKLEIMVALVSDKTIDKVLLEFKEYAGEVDVEFVRKSVLAIGRCAIKLDSAAERCIKVLQDLIQTKVNYVVQEAIIVIKDIFRKYPNRYENIIGTLCENLESLDEPAAKAAMVWIVGEYAGRINNSPELLEGFVDGFEEESAEVQLAVLTATVKLFLQRPDDAKELVSQVLNLATESSDNPDLRDRGYVYWRLLSTDPAQAQAVVLAKKPVISDDTFKIEPAVLAVLIANLSTLSSIYHKAPEQFVKGAKGSITLKPTQKAGKKKRESRSGSRSGSGSESSSSESEEDSAKEKEDKKAGNESSGNDSDASDRSDAEDDKASPTKKKNGSGSSSGSDSGSNSSDSDSEKKRKEDKRAGKGGAPPAGGGATVDLLGLFDTPAGGGSGGGGGVAPVNDGVDRKVWLPKDQGKGLQILGAFVRRQGTVVMDMVFENHSAQPLVNFVLKINNNFAGLQASAPLKVATVAPGGRSQATLPLNEQGKPEGKPGVLQMAIKSDLGVAYFQPRFPVFTLFGENGKLEKKQFLGLWADISDEEEKSLEVANRTANSVEDIKKRCESQNVFYIAARAVPEKGEVVYFSVLCKGIAVLLELTVNGPSCTACAKSSNAMLSMLALSAIVQLLTGRT